ncbi:MAG TPA: hypothetical protein VNN73_19535 [Blastocatellia bacterium]|nr:hypothetical protein [Blastocatellia bacterium]
MNKLARIIIIILVAFAIASLLLYKLRLGSLSRPSQQSGIHRTDNVEMQTIEGEIGDVDEQANTLTLVGDGQQVTLAFDERTAIVEEGQHVQPSAIKSGKAARVRYTERGGRNWARRIELASSTRPGSE